MLSKREECLIGLLVSNCHPSFGKKVKSGLSAGRVQSVAVRLIVEREKSISSFKLNSEFSILARLITKDKLEFVATSTKQSIIFKTQELYFKVLSILVFLLIQLKLNHLKAHPQLLLPHQVCNRLLQIGWGFL